MKKLITKWFNNRLRKIRISESNKRFYREHGLTRRVPVRDMDGTRSYMYLERR
jgi:hypothetical protein